MKKSAIAYTVADPEGMKGTTAGFPNSPVQPSMAMGLLRRRRTLPGGEGEAGMGDAISEGASEMVNQLSRKIATDPFMAGVFCELVDSGIEKDAVFGWLMGSIARRAAVPGPKLSKPPLQQGIEKLRISTQARKPQALRPPAPMREPEPGAEFAAADRRIPALERKR